MLCGGAQEGDGAMVQRGEATADVGGAGVVNGVVGFIVWFCVTILGLWRAKWAILWASWCASQDETQKRAASGIPEGGKGHLMRPDQRGGVSGGGQKRRRVGHGDGGGCTWILSFWRFGGRLKFGCRDLWKKSDR